MNYYTWTNVFDNDLDLYLNLLNWEDSSFLLNTDIFFIFSIIEDSLTYSYNSTIIISIYSFLDYFFEMTNSVESSFCVKYFFMDLFLFVELSSKKVLPLFLGNNIDGIMLMASIDNSFIFFFIEWSSFISHFNLFSNPSILYDVFSFNISFSYFNFILFIKWFFIFYLFILFFVNVIRYNSLRSSSNYSFYRLFFFINTISFENRIQFDFMFLFSFFVLFIWVIILLTFNDVFSEVVELFHLLLIYYFVFIILYLLFKYSLHYFSFLENSMGDGFTTSFILKQMVRDFSNTFALFLRFFVLLFRLNIYDGLDDFLDSYYIFFCDFDEDDYWDDTFFLLNSFFFSFDNNNDIIFYLDLEDDFWFDLFLNYFVLFGKLYFFLIFILEEIFRVSLAFYIFYLIIFEVHSVNVAFSEDNFHNNKRC